MNFNLIKGYTKEFSWVFLGQFLTIIVTIGAIKIITHLFPPDIFGYFSYGMTLALGFNQLLFGPLSGSFSRFYSISFDNNNINSFYLIIRNILKRSVKNILIITALLVVTGEILNFKLDYIFFILIVIYSILTGLLSSINALHSAKRNRKLIAIIGSIEPLTRVIIILLLFILFIDSPITLISSYIISTLLILIISLIFLNDYKIKKIENVVEDLGLKKDILKYSNQTSLWGIFTWIYLSSDKWLLEYFSSDFDVGIYVVLLQIGFYPMSLVGGLLIQFFSPIFFEKINKSGDNHLKFDNIIKKLILGTLFLSAIVSLTSVFCHEIVFDILTDERYSEYSYLLPFMIFSGGLFSASQLLSMSYQYNLKMKILMNGKIITSFLGIVLNLLGVYYNGIIGLAISSIVYSFISLLFFYFFRPIPIKI